MIFDPSNPQPGVYENVSWEDYLLIDAMNPSTLKRSLRSFKHMKRCKDENVGPDRKVVAVGNAVHAFLSDEFDERFVEMPEFEKQDDNLTAGKTNKPPKTMKKANGELSASGKKWVDLCEKHGKPETFQGVIVTDQERTESKLTKFYQSSVKTFEEQAETAGQEVLTAVQINVAKKVIGEINKNPAAVEMLNGCQSELTVIAMIGGVLCKTRIDHAKPRERMVADTKTTRDIEPDILYRQAKKMGYYFQFAFHVEALALAPGGWNTDIYYMLAAEVCDDFETGLIFIPNEVIEYYRKIVRIQLDKYKTALETGKYLGLYGVDGYGDLAVPDYHMEQGEEGGYNPDKGKEQNYDWEAAEKQQKLDTKYEATHTESVPF